MFLDEIQKRIEQAVRNISIHPTFVCREGSRTLEQILEVHLAGDSIAIRFRRKELEYGETSSAREIAHKISIAKRFLCSSTQQ